MAMRMPPQVAQQSAFPEINRASLVLFGGLTLVVLNLFWVNGGNIVSAIFHKGAPAQPIIGLPDQLWQVLGVVLLTLLAEYGGEGAGSAAVWFLLALWLLWLINHAGTRPASASSSSVSSSLGGGGGGVKK